MGLKSFFVKETLLYPDERCILVKKKFSMKSLMSLVLCVITVLGSFPMPAYAQTMDENGAVAYEIGDRVWVRGEDVDPSEEAPQGTFWRPEYDNDQPVKAGSLHQAGASPRICLRSRLRFGAYTF